MARYDYDRSTFYFPKDERTAEEEKLKTLLEKLGRKKTPFVCFLVSLFESVHGVDVLNLSAEDLLQYAALPNSVPLKNVLLAMMGQTGQERVKEVKMPEIQPFAEQERAEDAEFVPGQADMLKSGLLDFGV